MGTLTVSAIAGIFAPFAVSYLKGTNWSERAKQVVAALVALVIGFGITVVDNGVSIHNWDELVANFAVVYSVANIWYTTYFGGTSLNEVLENTPAGLRFK